MASIRPKLISCIKDIYRRKKGGTFYITYQARPGERHTVKGCKDRVATEALARKLEADAMLRREGVIDTRAEKLALSESAPLEDHIAAFEATLRAKGGTEEHVRRTLTFIRNLAAACRFERLTDLDAARVSAHVGDLKRQGMGARSINARLTAHEESGWAHLARRLDRKDRPQPSLFDPPPLDEPADDEPVLVNLKSVRLQRLRDFGDVWLALGLWRLLDLARVAFSRDARRPPVESLWVERRGRAVADGGGDPDRRAVLRALQRTPHRGHVVPTHGARRPSGRRSRAGPHRSGPCGTTGPTA